MSDKKNESGRLLPISVTEGLTVNVLPDSHHEYLMSSKEVSIGYDVTEYNIRQHKLQHPDELRLGKHFVTAVSIPNSGLPHNAILWTKRGIVRLGFFIRSERAKLFRDWAEDLIINLEQRQRDLFNEPVRPKQISGRNHNRLSPARLIDILADVALIEQKDLRERLVNKLILKGGRV